MLPLRPAPCSQHARSCSLSHARARPRCACPPSPRSARLQRATHNKCMLHPHAPAPHSHTPARTCSYQAATLALWPRDRSRAQRSIGIAVHAAIGHNRRCPENGTAFGRQDRGKAAGAEAAGESPKGSKGTSPQPAERRHRVDQRPPHSSRPHDNGLWRFVLVHSVNLVVALPITLSRAVHDDANTPSAAYVISRVGLVASLSRGSPE